ncbi:MAG: hypothetical protein WCA49_21380 [Candidatus Sulfotelmatobacter sp.]
MSISGLVRSGIVPRIVAIGFVLACLVLMSGCPVKSLNGLDEGGNDPDIVLDARLVGTWPSVGEKCTSTLTITAHEKVYSWQVVDCESNKKTSYEARLFKLDQHYFLDMTAPSEEVCDLCIGIHLIYSVQFEKDSVALAPLDYDWFKKAVQKKRVSLATLPDDPGTITSPPKDLKAFCRKYADNKEAFKPDPDSILKRQ